MSELIQLKDISFKYDESDYILKDINLTLNEGGFLGILGPNGGGKSTLLKIIVGLLTPESGDMIYDGKMIHSKREIPFEQISYVPQTDILDTALPLRIKDLVSFGRLDKKKNGPGVHEVMDIVGLSKDIMTPISNLSGGERQRALIAKALMNSPRLLLLDEPTKGLDGRGQDQLLELIEDIRKDLNTAIILVDHNINQVVRHCDRILCLNRDLHWHDKKELLDKNILENIYHCEFEHLKIHDEGGDHLDHRHESCDHHHDQHEHEEKK